ncbi:DUF2726 domain-containing protein [Klebsiella michiganensis]|uniref:DUF2726 domain-containing protein n=1 Tax=Klebsiella michiganensis TaxID=1134687 RepID=A0A1Q8YU95_9ENTR|nr:DUF2726 domain-containing protein [Klebsiella michiganensis]AKL32788.1 hypothetical protein AB185_02315 [Klebsiella oxytoca]ELS5414584.1 DUF2726 domain-containing protein [Klebsiella michiganensis]MBW5995833.1 DUF2726 domain-containing protein [Klebsiella michiganensis]OLP11579.1 hypothetical protein AGG97_19755 [Klebsiella michiganensis]PLL43605.1 DUF2726 domain-containing protein [Klebsiella michiganensis]
MAKILMMAGIAVVLMSLLGFAVLLLRGRIMAGTSPVLMSLKALGIRPSEAEKRLCRERVRVADIATLAPHIRPRSRAWWQLFRMASQWHCDVVIVDIRTFAIVAAIELDDASHLKRHRIRRDILLEEVLRQAGIPLLRDRDSEKLVRRIREFLRHHETDTDIISTGGMAPSTEQTEPGEKAK